MRTISRKRAIAIALTHSPADGSPHLGLALHAFTERGHVLSEFHRAELLTHLARQKPATKLARSELNKLRRFIESIPVNSTVMSKTKH